LRKKIILFGDSSSYITTILYKSFIENLNDNFELIAVINTTPKQRKSILKNIISYALKKLFNPFNKNIIFNNYVSFLKLIDKNLPVIHCENVNDENFINNIKKLNPNNAFLMGCPQILQKDIIGCFDKVINYHNSYLPTYRGLEATSWAMTYGEKYTGYTFHYINEKVDDGRVLFQEKIEINYSISSYENELIKTKKSTQNIEKILDLVSQNFEGIEQVGKASYYGTKEKKELLSFSTFEDIKRTQALINIWGYIELNKIKENIIVTHLLENGSINRINFLPVFLYRIYIILKKGVQN
jgi:methionyl-tRNA formyltransferase